MLQQLEQKQKAAAKKRADKKAQWALTWTLLGESATASEIIIQLERTFFLNRKQATAMYEETAQYEIDNADCLGCD